MIGNPSIPLFNQQTTRLTFTLAYELIKHSPKGRRDRKIMSSPSLNTDALNKTRLLINGDFIQRSISLNKINISIQ